MEAASAPGGAPDEGQMSAIEHGGVGGVAGSNNSKPHAAKEVSSSEPNQSSLETKADNTLPTTATTETRDDEPIASNMHPLAVAMSAVRQQLSMQGHQHSGNHGRTSLPSSAAINPNTAKSSLYQHPSFPPELFALYTPSQAPAQLPPPPQSTRKKPLIELDPLEIKEPRLPNRITSSTQPAPILKRSTSSPALQPAIPATASHMSGTFASPKASKASKRASFVAGAAVPLFGARTADADDDTPLFMLAGQLRPPTPGDDDESDNVPLGVAMARSQAERPKSFIPPTTRYLQPTSAARSRNVSPAPHRGSGHRMSRQFLSAENLAVPSSNPFLHRQKSSPSLGANHVGVAAQPTVTIPRPSPSRSVRHSISDPSQLQVFAMARGDHRGNSWLVPPQPVPSTRVVLTPPISPRMAGDRRSYQMPPSEFSLAPSQDRRLSLKVAGVPSKQSDDPSTPSTISVSSSSSSASSSSTQVASLKASTPPRRTGQRSASAATDIPSHPSFSPSPVPSNGTLASSTSSGPSAASGAPKVRFADEPPVLVRPSFEKAKHRPRPVSWSFHSVAAPSLPPSRVPVSEPDGHSLDELPIGRLLAAQKQEKARKRISVAEMESLEDGMGA
ncbi:hypothetical protein HDU96_002650 [Phlyctochytrium bullatum]|nr:hypothetical protein HDU96_002650 [Phlyctochytrium bullatum]